ncbi:MAG TPA: MBL fold metallo-hydrolase [Bauldia sp.]|nr:MBL fold metallo-hydrolase [Bauldia sp.]
MSSAGVVATILGCGSSPGVPRIGNDWGACDPNEPRNRRLRCSLLVERMDDAGAKTVVLIDTSPDMRAQLLAADVKRLDGVLYTHAHADHCHGIDDLRTFWIVTKRRVDTYADAETQARLDEAFSYCFRTPPGSNYPPILQPHRIEPGVPVTIAGPGGPLTFMPFRQEHGDIHSLGFRVGGLAYSCDASGIPADTVPHLANLDTWILDALRYQPHPSHLSLKEALAWIARVKPRQAILTHMHIELDYQTLRRELPEGVAPAYDGLRIAVNL